VRYTAEEEVRRIVLEEVLAVQANGGHTAGAEEEELHSDLAEVQEARRTVGEEVAGNHHRAAEVEDVLLEGSDREVVDIRPAEEDIVQEVVVGNRQIVAVEDIDHNLAAAAVDRREHRNLGKTCL
jgi:hypothetical protein